MFYKHLIAILEQGNVFTPCLSVKKLSQSAKIADSLKNSEPISSPGSDFPSDVSNPTAIHKGGTKIEGLTQLQDFTEGKRQ